MNIDLKLSTNVLVIVYICFTIFGFSIQDSEDKMLNDFKISLQASDSGMNLTCLNGCAWKSLSYECPENQCNVNIDNYGMNGTGETKERDFVINIQNNGNTFNLVCDTGCAWKTLDLRGVIPNSTTYIDTYGLSTSTK